MQWYNLRVLLIVGPPKLPLSCDLVLHLFPPLRLPCSLDLPITLTYVDLSSSSSGESKIYH